MPETVSGISHIHTDFSYDGESSLEEVAKLAKKKGHSFLLLTEHNDDFNDGKMERFVAECEQLSTGEFIIIPGLEINCDFGRHLLGIGVRRYIPMAGPDEVIGQIRQSGGLAVFPHPGLYQFRPFLKSVNNLNGIEVWNNRYDGKYAPNLRSLELLKDLRIKNPGIFAYAGLDLHSTSKFDCLCLKIELAELTETEILSSLKAGEFRLLRKRTEIDSTGDITKTQKLIFDIAASANMVAEALCPR